MKIVTFVKGHDDFGREKISGNVYEYSHHYPRINNGDLLLYYFPQGGALGIYQTKEELEHYSDVEGFQYCRGKICRWEGKQLEFVDLMKAQNLAIGNDLEKTICDLLDKYEVK